jgi:AmmeMemoRadiSam system protein A
MDECLSPDEKLTLLRLARQAIENGVRGESLPQLDITLLTLALLADGASFVTLTMDDKLRGCIGALEPYQSLVEDVREHAVAAALQDYRFPTVRINELPAIKIEISRLTIPEFLEYSDNEDLLAKLHPGKDGVILRDGFHRATFLPQVWEKIPDPADFLSNLCNKLNAPPDKWKRNHLDVLIYQVEEFHE